MYFTQNKMHDLQVYDLVDFSNMYVNKSSAAIKTLNIPINSP